MEHIKMILQARFKGKSAIHNRLTPLIPLKGDIATYHRSACGKGHWPLLRGAGGI
jgi:hypothetical protein